MTDYAVAENVSNADVRDIWADAVGAAVRNHRHYLAFCCIYMLSVWLTLAVLVRDGTEVLLRNLGIFSFDILVPLSYALLPWVLICVIRAGRTHWREIPKRFFEARYLRPERLTATLIVLLPLICVLAGFTALKVEIGHLLPFALDKPIIEWTRWLTGGPLAWEYLIGWFGHPWALRVMDTAYYAWFPLLMITSTVQIFSVHRPHLRLQFLTTMVMCWGVLGTYAAFLLSSAGPVFLPELWGGPTPFDGLIHHLEDVNAHRFPLMAVRVQHGLWWQYATHGTASGSGISAMPSLHVAMATTMALLGWRLGRLWGIAYTAFAGLIFIASIMLAYHYALDGVVGAIGTIAIWTLVGRHADRTHPRHLEPLPKQA